MHGNPWLRPHRRDVENLIATRSGDRYPRERKVRTTELAHVNRKLTQLRALAAFEEGGRRFWPITLANRTSGVRWHLFSRRCNDFLPM
jgi:hypothetical protein